MSGLNKWGWGKKKNRLWWRVLGREWESTFPFGHAKFEVPVRYTREDTKPTRAQRRNFGWNHALNVSV